MSIGIESPIGLFNLAEQEVFNALHELPTGFQVQSRPEAVTIENGGKAYLYEPDFVISDSEGRTLIVEVKSAPSMSWSNMARFVQIDRYARAAGAAFLVLVPGAATEHPKWPAVEFDEVNVSYGEDEPGMVQAVISALHKSPAAARRD